MEKSQPSNTNQSISKLLPILLGFFVMGFVDIIGIGSNYVKQDFTLTDSTANLMSMAVFMWFFILSIPTALIMNKIGRKTTVIISMVFTTVALIIPFFVYTFSSMLFAFAFLGIGNTIIQVALNPLLSNVVSGNKLTSSITMGQFIKAIASAVAPLIAKEAAAAFGDWKLIFPVFAAITVLSTIWLISTSIKEEPVSGKTSSFGECLSLLNDKMIFLFFLGILTVVGIDVGLNTTAPKIMERAGLTLDTGAGYSTSLYFMFRTIGAFCGAIILAKFSAKKFYIISSVAAIVAFVGLLFAQDKVTIYILIALAGFACASLFAIIFSFALKRMPTKSNEVSGLMIMGVAGGGIFSWLMGVSSDAITMGPAQFGAVAVLVICCVYQLFLSLSVKEVKGK